MKSWLKILHLIFIKDVIPKIISVFLATFLWYYATILSIEKTYVNLPVEIIDIPAGISLEYNKDTNIKVELQAREDVSLYIQRLRAVVSLANAVKGKQIYPITLENLPEGINYDITPKNISIELFEIVTNEVPIVLDTVSNPYSKITNYTLSPDTINIIGSADRVKAVSSIKTESLDLNTLNNVTYFITNIKIKSLHMIEITPNIPIRVEGQLEHYHITNKVFLPITIENLSAKLVIPSIPSIQFTVLTADSNIELLLLKTEVKVDLSNITNAGTHKLPVTIIGPERLKFLMPPETVTLLIENDPELTEKWSFQDKIEIIKTNSNQSEETEGSNKNSTNTNETLK
ncbi:MAG: CdaR family protein [Brevinema sp.]